MKRYDKLVHDKIPEVIAAEGKRRKTLISLEAELQEHLMAKLYEEEAEFEN